MRRETGWKTDSCVNWPRVSISSRWGEKIQRRLLFQLANSSNSPLFHRASFRATRCIFVYKSWRILIRRNDELQAVMETREFVFPSIKPFILLPRHSTNNTFLFGVQELIFNRRKLGIFFKKRMIKYRLL